MRIFFHTEHLLGLVLDFLSMFFLEIALNDSLSTGFKFNTLPAKHFTTFRFSVFREYRKATPGCNRLTECDASSFNMKTFTGNLICLKLLATCSNRDIRWPSGSTHFSCTTTHSQKLAAGALHCRHGNSIYLFHKVLADVSIRGMQSYFEIGYIFKQNTFSSLIQRT